MHKALRHIVIIKFSHYVQGSCFFGDLNQVFFNSILAPTVGAKDGTLTLRAVALVHPKRFFWEQNVTCSAHFKEHAKTNLAE